MIGGVHTILYSKNAEALRAFFRDVLELPSVDAGQGWLIFAAPPAEIAVHPAGEGGHHELFLMCTDIEATVERLKGKGVGLKEPVSDQGWGLLARIELPDGEPLGLYEPRHPMAIRMTGAGKPASKGARKAVRKSAGKAAARKAGGKPAGKAARKSARKAAGKPARKAVRKPASKAPARPARKAAGRKRR